MTDEDWKRLIEKDLEEVRKAQLEDRKELERYKGRWGGIIMVVSAIWACVMAFLEFGD